MSYFLDDDASQIRELKDKIEKLQADKRRIERRGEDSICMLDLHSRNPLEFSCDHRQDPKASS